MVADNEASDGADSALVAAAAVVSAVEEEDTGAEIVGGQMDCNSKSEEWIHGEELRYKRPERRRVFSRRGSRILFC